MDLRLRGKRALVTGASKGIGAAVAETLAGEGCDLELAARNEDALKALAARLHEEHGVGVGVHPVDLRSADAIARLAAEVADVDILVNNAGDIPSGSIEALDADAWRRGWELKVFGYIELTRLYFARMKARGGGVIVNDIGASGEQGDFDYVAGSAGNAALMSLTRTLGGRVSEHGVRVVGVNPGPVETERIVALMKGIAKGRLGDPDRYPELMAGFPMGRPATPAEVADAIAFLASERSAYTSGVILTIDGGLTAGASM
ncbi:MAG TPA: SDR family oxidoreductase [Solirubrobacterales bacterium]|jgi:hypothetical protein